MPFFLLCAAKGALEAAFGSSESAPDMELIRNSSQFINEYLTAMGVPKEEWTKLRIAAAKNSLRGRKG